MRILWDDDLVSLSCDLVVNSGLLKSFDGDMDSISVSRGKKLCSQRLVGNARCGRDGSLLESHRQRMLTTVSKTAIPRRRERAVEVRQGQLTGAAEMVGDKQPVRATHMARSCRDPY